MRRSKKELMDEFHRKFLALEKDYKRLLEEQSFDERRNICENIAIRLRTLFHGGESITSIIKIRGKMLFPAGNQKNLAKDVLPYMAYFYQSLSKDSSKFVIPDIEKVLKGIYLDFNVWWNEILIDNRVDFFVTRGEIINGIANSEIAHARNFDEKLYSLVQENILGWTKGSGIPFDNLNEVQYLLLQVICKEALHSYELLTKDVRNVSPYKLNTRLNVISRVYNEVFFSICVFKPSSDPKFEELFIDEKRANIGYKTFPRIVMIDSTSGLNFVSSNHFKKKTCIYKNTVN